MIRLSLLATVILLGTVPAANAFDCAKATTAIERTICANPAVKAADDAMGEAYAALRSRQDEAQRAALKGDQVDWLKRRENLCLNYGDKAPPPADPACLRRETERRTRLLSGTPEYAGPGAPSFAPVFYRKVDEGRQIEISLVWPQVDGPGMGPLNGLVARATSGGEVNRDAVEGPYGNTMGYRIGYASDRLISIAFDGYEFTGGAHGMGYASAVNYLPQAGRALQLDDVLDARGKAALIPLCRASIAAEKRARAVPEELIDSSMSDEALADSINSISAWSFGQDGAQIHYDAYALGSYAEGAYDCAVSWADLKGIVKWGAPLPF
ncbi:DUF1311 domain-containing protein [Oleomonas cavernae]|uniref:DUF1311 domain-containing protein n=1 Tax=Oleomonas cavernae TaxID=2320859 RepID=A0A418WDB6_9PROT|nr:lysozyme inhibitor LprI family protein [Oleomonas cavernae]RJF87966.1 DUF1311 domain-containing protein [Oleomonas cavernae]